MNATLLLLEPAGGGAEKWAVQARGVLESDARHLSRLPLVRRALQDAAAEPYTQVVAQSVERSCAVQVSAVARQPAEVQSDGAGPAQSAARKPQSGAPMVSQRAARPWSLVAEAQPPDVAERPPTALAALAVGLVSLPAGQQRPAARAVPGSQPALAEQRLAQRASPPQELWEPRVPAQGGGQALPLRSSA